MLLMALGESKAVVRTPAMKRSGPTLTYGSCGASALGTSSKDLLGHAHSIPASTTHKSSV